VGLNVALYVEWTAGKGGAMRGIQYATANKQMVRTRYPLWTR
jgi:hypothetical protein